MALSKQGTPALDHEGVGQLGLAVGISRSSPAPVVGHIGWAIQLADGTFFAGATEAFNALQDGGYIPPGQNNYAWAKPFADLSAALAAFKGSFPNGHASYTWWKAYDLPNPNCDAAMQQGIANKQAGYTFLTNNCLDHAAAVLNAYGVPWQNDFGQPSWGLPWKQTNPTPVGWLNAWNVGPAKSL